VRVAGTHVLQAPPERVWDALRDPEVLARTIPGCREVQRIADGDYRMRVHATVASVAGTCDGRMEVTDRSDHACTMRVTAGGEPGTIAGTTTVRLVEDGPDRTVVHYNVDAVIGGAVSAVGQRVLAGVAQRGASQFFEAVDRYLADEVEALQVAAPLDDRLVRPASSTTRPLLLAGLAGAVLAAGVVLLARRKR
jgi:carbon monoxide dehydrogenase subunit G